MNRNTYIAALIEAGCDAADAKTMADKKFGAPTPDQAKAKAKAKTKAAPVVEESDDEESDEGEAPTASVTVVEKHKAKASTAGAVRKPAGGSATFKTENGTVKTIPNAAAVMAAGPLVITIATADGGVLETVMAYPRTFNGGSWGWFANVKTGVPTPAGTAQLSASLNLTVSGSKKAHDQGST